MTEQAKHGRITTAAGGRGVGARARLRVVALLALAAMVAGLASAAAAELLPHPPEVGSAAGSETTPCADPDSDGGPCDPSCPCSCCPGHVQTLAFAAERVAVAAPPASELEPAPIGVLCSNGQHHRIFHPPRT